MPFSFVYNPLTADLDINEATSSGPITIANGGTGSASFNINGPVISGTTTTSPLTALTMTDGQLLIGKTGLPPVLGTITAGTNIAVTNGAGTVTVAAMTGAPVLAYVESAVTPYIVSTANNVIGIDCSGAIKTVHLPNAPTTAGTSWTIKDYTGNCAINNITLTTPGGAVLIDLAATYLMNIAYASVTVVWTGTKYIVI